MSEQFFDEPKHPNYSPNAQGVNARVKWRKGDAWEWIHPKQGAVRGSLPHIPVTTEELIRREYAAQGITLSKAGLRARARGDN